MGDWTIDDNQFLGTRAEVTVTSGTSVTSGVANTKTTTAVVLAAQTQFAYSGLIVSFRNKGSAGDYLVDILTGASGSEVVLIPNLYVGGKVAAVNCYTYYLPISIAQGTRLSVKTQCSSASATLGVVLVLVAGSFAAGSPCSRVITVGDVVSTTKGTALTAPGTANVWPAWTTIGNTRGFQTRYVICVPCQRAIAVRTNAQLFTAGWAIGASPSTTDPPIVANWPAWQTDTSSFMGTFGMPLPVSIPPNTQLSARYTSSALTTLGVDGIMYCIG